MLNTYAKIAFLLLALVLSSCAFMPASAYKKKQQKAPVAYVIHALNVPSAASPISFPFPKITLKEQGAPRVEVTTVKFNAMEINHVCARDKVLFSKNKKLNVNTEVYEQDEFAFPLPGAKVISAYGGRRKGHTGIDLKTRANDTIVAAFSGTVRMAKPYSAYGNVIVIRHYNGLETVYSHNSKNLVTSGTVVKAGDPIALTGRTGRASTEHLHFEMRVNGEHFNPTILINFNNRKLKRNRFVFTLAPKGNVQIVPAVMARPVS